MKIVVINDLSAWHPVARDTLLVNYNKAWHKTNFNTLLPGRIYKHTRPSDDMCLTYRTIRLIDDKEMYSQYCQQFNHKAVYRHMVLNLLTEFELLKLTHS